MIPRAIALASMMAVVSGVVCILAGVLRLGFITELLSKPIRFGYMNGIALTVLISQLPRVFGFSVDIDGPATNLLYIFKAIIDGLTHGTTFITGAATLLIILLLKRYPRFPGILLAVVGATPVIGLAIVIAVIEFLWDGWRPHFPSDALSSQQNR